ncbi:VF530 family protein [Candidatus Gracilibacteria bacterium]|nr:VF530 family protein [Candidatus Gracilibacteria bacterium]MCF7898628.1 VF530 family protein [Candidatus Paceibacterota bacterium]
MNEHSNDPLYGKTLQSILEFLVKEYGFEELGTNIKIKCFTTDPSISSSLKFLRKTPWARVKIEELYISTINSQLKRRL